MDLDISLSENTTATSLQVSYRVANGSCDLMTFENCVDDAFITLNLKCRQDSGLWIQVLLPEDATGEVTLNVDANPSPDQSCEPVNPFIPASNFTFLADCAGEAVTFINQSSVGDSLSYFWDFGDGFTSSFLEPTHVFAMPDTYVVSLVVTSPGRSDTTARQLIIFPIPQASISIPDTVIAGVGFTPGNNSTNSILSSTYYWDFCASQGLCSSNYSTFSGEHPPSIIYEIPGTYEICMTMGNGNCYDTICETVVVQTFNYYTGGPYDGTDHHLNGTCDTINFFTGGPYDGFDHGVENSTCTEINFFTGGPYDGFGEDLNDTVCPVIMASIYSGGPYDGHDEASILLNCPLPASIWAGGPYDGEGAELLEGNCQSINFFTGGPYDGTDEGKDSTNCTPINFYTGGPYDGTDQDGEDIACTPINFFTGGPYDGTDKKISGYGTIDISDLTLCIGDTGLLTASGLTNWYSAALGGLQLASLVDSFMVYNLNQTTQIYVEDGCNGTGLSPVTVHLIDTFSVDYAYTLNCVSSPSFFSNQTLFAGNSTPTVGTELVAYGSQGLAPGFNQVTFSGGTAYNFTYLGDDQNANDAIRFNNSSAGTVWVQWQYFTAKSVDRISLWQNPSFPTKYATEARLYYSDGGPWILTKVFSQSQLQNPQFVSGNICETQGKYAQRWKLELDAPEANAPYLQELQVYANEATTNGTVVWDYGDGSPIDTAVNPMHWFPAPGTYNVTMILPEVCGCQNAITRAVDIVTCSTLPLLEHELTGIMKQNQFIELTWTVDGDFQNAYMEKYIDGQWKSIQQFPYNEQSSYFSVDSSMIYNADNLYRVRVETETGDQFSNQLSFHPTIDEVFASLYPNPVEDGFAELALRLPDRASIEINLYNHLGQHLETLAETELVGSKVLELPLEDLAYGHYFIHVNINGYPRVFKVLVMNR